MKGYGKFLDGIEKIEKLFLAVTVAIMIIVITYQVILRYVFSASNAWSEELARYLFIYDVMVAAALPQEETAICRWMRLSVFLSPERRQSIQ